MGMPVTAAKSKPSFARPFVELLVALFAKQPDRLIGPTGAPYDPSLLYIPLCLENPKIGRAYDAEVVSDRIAEDRPVFRYLLAQEM